MSNTIYGFETLTLVNNETGESFDLSPLTEAHCAFDKDFEKVVDLEVVEPCEFAKLQLSRNGSRRSFNLSRIDQKEKGFCTWCEKTVPTNRRRWCSEECTRSAMFYCFPQDPAPKMYRLIFTQEFACKACGLSFEEEIRKLIKKRYDSHNKFLIKYGHKPEKITLHYLGYGTGDKWQTDHIVPVHKGGAGIDPNNLQVLCVPCHREKTKEDLR